MTVFLLITLVIFIIVIASFYRHFRRSGKRSDKWLGIALAIVLPILTLLGYLTIGDLRALRDTTQTNLLSQPAVEQNLTPEQIKSAITALEAETQQNPNDLNKLVMLANSYAISQRYSDSAATWDKVIKLDGSAETLLRAADAHSFANKGVVNATAQNLIDRALQLVPQHPQGLWMAGMSAAQKGELAKAKDFWTRLYPMLANQPEQQKELATLLQQIDDELNQNSASQPSQNKVNVAKGAKIIINVSLDPKVVDHVKPSDTVFVFARATQGPPAPLAVKRLQVSDLPTTVELTEQDAMMPQMTISSFPKIKISAKVSKSGNPTIREGDINSESIELESLENLGEQSLVIGR